MLMHGIHGIEQRCADSVCTQATLAQLLLKQQRDFDLQKCYFNEQKIAEFSYQEQGKL